MPRNSFKLMLRSDWLRSVSPGQHQFESNLSNTGVDLYFNEMFPFVDWTMPTGRIGIGNLLKRFDRLLQKIVKCNGTRARLEWSSLISVIDGIRKMFLQQRAFVISNHVAAMSQSMVAILSDNYPVEKGGLVSEALLSRSLGKFRKI